MSAWPSTISQGPHLSGTEGELIQVRVSTDPRLLEDLLECLAGVPFPINPQIFHGRPTVVEFPAYRARLGQVKDALKFSGFGPDSVSVSSMLRAISA
jgi:hypothetical protein